MMDAEHLTLMAYVDGEVRTLCGAMGWRHQIRRKWSVREIPAEESAIGDYEWKLIPGAENSRSEAEPGAFEGVYYLLSFNAQSRRFVLQHDTVRAGVLGTDFEVETYSEIRPHHFNEDVMLDEHGWFAGDPPPGWLRDHLSRLLRRFRPNTFSIT